MSKSLKQIIIIIFLSTVIGLVRYYFLTDTSFTLLKKARILEESKSELNDSGEAIFVLPDFISEPMMASLDFTKYFFDNQKAIIIDARDPSEFQTKHIAGAMNIPFENYDEYVDIINNLNYQDLYIIYCSGGECSLSLDLADILFFDNGFENIFVFEGGLPEWEEAGYPVND